MVLAGAFLYFAANTDPTRTGILPAQRPATRARATRLLALHATGGQQHAPLGCRHARKQCPGDLGRGDGPVVRRNERAEELAHSHCHLLDRALWLAERLAVSRKQRRASNDQSVERKLRQ